jgi:hypothetical protein
VVNSKDIIPIIERYSVGNSLFRTARHGNNVMAAWWVSSKVMKYPRDVHPMTVKYFIPGSKVPFQIIRNSPEVLFFGMIIER